MDANLGPDKESVDNTLAEIREKQILRRIWNHDFTVWQQSPDEITNRLGWLHSPEKMAGDLTPISAFVDSIRGEDFKEVLLLGMGGSSLAPEVFSHAFGPDHDGLKLAVLDSTDPGAVAARSQAIDPQQTLFIVSTKSGGTVETLSFFKYFYNVAAGVVGPDLAGSHFVAITDEGSRLHDLAQRFRFRKIFLNDPNIGGRFAALSYFGLVPAALVGVNLEQLLDRALVMVRNNESGISLADGDSLGGFLGAAMGALAKKGRDKITLVTSPKLANFGDWVEQLIAESTGKSGTGILPVVGETVGNPEVYGRDRYFVHLRVAGDETQDDGLQSLAKAGFPVITLHLRDRYDMGGQFFLWEIATAVAGHVIGIHPFNQPNVEAAKVQARKTVEVYKETGALPVDDAAPLTSKSLVSFLEQSKEGDYIAIQAYLQPGSELTAALQRLRHKLQERTHLAVTVGYGPRFLHSTGQLHKGDRGNGLFIQLISDPEQDVPIPDEAGKDTSTMTFGLLKTSQALGDAAALREVNRRLIRFKIGGNLPAEFDRLTGAL